MSSLLVKMMDYQPFKHRYSPLTTNHPEAPKRWRLWLVAACAISLAATYYFWIGQGRFKGHSEAWRLQDHRSPHVAAGNATLGFQVILALSRQTPWRIHGLQAAAAYIGIHIDVPTQHPATDDEVATFKSAGLAEATRPGDGSAKAWLAHLDLLQYFLNTTHTTALILEDDADWDIALREQMGHVSDAVRMLTNVSDEDARGDLFGRKSPLPYGLDWDVLWIGNCGDNAGEAMNRQANGEVGAIRTWRDSSAVPHPRYTGWAHNAIVALPSGSRAAMKTVGPVCTYAYAATRAGAKRIIEMASEGIAQAFDTRLGILCQEGQLTCFTVVPEVIHEYKPAPSKNGALASEVDAANGQGDMVNVNDEGLETTMGSTDNIVVSARCKALFNKTCWPSR